MIDYISGNIADLSPTRIVIDNHGMGYGLEISLQTYEALRNSKEAKVYALTTVNQRDATEVMYGFATKDERDLFELIIGISGIGAASASTLISTVSSPSSSLSLSVSVSASALNSFSSACIIAVLSLFILRLTTFVHNHVSSCIVLCNVMLL